MNTNQGRDEILKLNRIETEVRKFFKRRRDFDEEELAVRIWFEAWSNSKTVDYALIKYRCIDEVRNEKRRRNLIEEKKDILTGEEILLNTESSIQDKKELVSRLIEQGSLSLKERDLIFQVFYLGKNLKELRDDSKKNSLEELTFILELALQKLRILALSMNLESESKSKSKEREDI